ncbi:MAG TPA: alanine--tRNA ligase-related protein [Candidatus Angelobacter sp.]
MTERLYYHDSFLYNFDACVIESLEREGRSAVVLDRTAFYPTSGGQVHDTGKLILQDGREVAVAEVADEEDGRIFHFTAGAVELGERIRGVIDSARRRDHVQQHSGQHVLSAAFVRLFDAPTVSFHMGVEICTIDLAVKTLTGTQVEQAELLANEVITQDRPVNIRFVSLDEARQLALRKLPPKQTGQLRLIDIVDFDLTACGGTHVRSTGQIGAILVRKIENVKQGARVEFACGLRAVAAARQDYTTLTQAAGLFSAHIRELPQQVEKSIQESKAAGKMQQKLLEELAELYAERMLAQAPSTPRAIVRFFSERDATFIKLLAQKLTAALPDVTALLASGAGQFALVFAQSPGMKGNMGQLMKEAMAKLGGRGGGSADMAQGGLPAGAGDPAKIQDVLRETAARFKPAL